MGRGVSAGGGQSSLGYLFGGGENTNDNTNNRASKSEGQNSNNTTTSPAAPSQPINNPPQIPTAAVDSKTAVDNSNPGATATHDSRKNNYSRPDGQNCGNFITVYLLSICIQNLSHLVTVLSC